MAVEDFVDWLWLVPDGQIDACEKLMEHGGERESNLWPLSVDYRPKTFVRPS